MTCRSAPLTTAFFFLALGACSQPSEVPGPADDEDVSIPGWAPDAVDAPADTGGGDPTPCDTSADCVGLLAGLESCEIASCDTEAHVCVVGPAKDAVPCEDGDPCTQDTVCMAGNCGQATAVDCDDGDPCTDDSCDSDTGCVSVQNALPCDDGDPCTADDTCVEGSCAGTPAECPCVGDADCAPLDDDDACNGTLRCQAGRCVVDPDSLVPCDRSGDGPCAQTTCDPATGQCSVALAEDGTACSDGDPCTSEDACSAGACAGVPGPCACAADPDCAAWDDADLCNGAQACVDGTCQIDPATVVTCAAAEGPCQESACDPETGECALAPLGDGAACDDGDVCTHDDACTVGACEGAPTVCDDGDPCTEDACDPETGDCVAPPKLCDDGDPCTDDVCDPDTGECAPGGSFCDDDDACTEDACDAGACSHLPTTCEPSSPCMMTTCDPDIGCVAEPAPAGVACSDLDSCTAGDACDGVGACVGQPACADLFAGKPCMSAWCVPPDGSCEWEVLSGCFAWDECVDEGAPAPGDVCFVCDPSVDPYDLVPVDCDDGDPCTEDACEAAEGGCTHAPVPDCPPLVDTCGDAVCSGEEATTTCPEDCGEDCGDGTCNGDEATASCPADCGADCGDGACNGGESTADCPEDCGAACGDGECNGGESTAACAADCGSDCGDGVCNGEESSGSCPIDCGSDCGDGACNGEESSGSCPIDCGSDCGDGACNGGEATTSCPDDCGSTCGDGACNGGEATTSCPDDCGSTCGDGACNGGEATSDCPGDCGTECPDETCNGDETTASCWMDCGTACGDGECNGDEATTSCPDDCGSDCGDGECNGGEATTDCADDCGAACGDGVCNGPEGTASCAQDCGSLCGDGACTSDEATTSCPEDCGTACGDGECNGGETSADCPGDCGTACGDGECNGDEATAACPDDCGSQCGDGACNGAEGTAGCPDDCGAECGDGACNGGEATTACWQDCGTACGDGECNGDEATTTCPDDCGAACGDGECNGGEATTTCPDDCGAACGDAVCNGPEGSATCPDDCGAVCGDGTCNADEATANCPEDCGTACGDGQCNGDEVTATCATDCGALCGDGSCNGGEGSAACPEDCGSTCGDGACNGDEATTDCPQDCGADCGDGVCNGDEGTATCPGDCGSSCGDHACNGDEATSTCPGDCGTDCGDDECNGGETTTDCPEDCGTACGDGECNGTESTSTCAADCGTQCGDGACNGGESSADCAQDCGADCGDGGCNGAESSASCPLDCGTDCGDGVCNGDEASSSCWQDCGASCGDDACNGPETTATCEPDCGAACGDGACNGNEATTDCPQDCGTGCPDGVCNGEEGTASCWQDCGAACGDGECNGDEATTDCPDDCGTLCGDGECNGAEATDDCPDDCGTFCGDGICNGDEASTTCPAECGSLCGDGACNGQESTTGCPGDCGTQCGDGTCNGGEASTGCPDDCGSLCGDGACNGPEATANCPDDCGTLCDDGTCNGDEATTNCPDDCGSVCGDGACNGPEASTGCPDDCGTLCGDGACNGGEATDDCPADCGTECGDQVCNGGEGTASCPADCGSSCGDGACNGSEGTVGCPGDCGTSCGDGACNGAEASTDCPTDCGASCSDGVCNGGEGSADCAEDCGSQCGDGACNGDEVTSTCPTDCGTLCGDGVCNGNETSVGCPTDCGSVCGDGACNGDESLAGCPADCAVCGDGTCSAGVETAATCAEDCVVCGDGECWAALESTVDCPGDCGTLCGDGVCNGGEGTASCWEECGTTCGDGACNGPEATADCPNDCGTLCGDGACNGDEGTATCPDDCGTNCGDGACNGDEGTASCPEDCGTACGDGACNGDESLASCAEDCAVCGDGTCSAGVETATSCVTDCVVCGDGVCHEPPETTAACPEDCGTACGDGACNGPEASTTCPTDCGAVCGDGVCNGPEGAASCAEDCVVCGDGACSAPDESTASCPDDCGSACGDGTCNGPESTATCPEDCGTECGDAVCNGSEDCVACAADCGTCEGSCCSAHGTVGCEVAACEASVCAADALCCTVGWDDECAACAAGLAGGCAAVPADCGACDVCDNGVCGAAETTASCPQDCGSDCGDGACNGPEATTDCPDDCGTLCGDEVCNGGEGSADCAEDCGSLCGDDACNGSEATADCPEDCGTSCGDGVCNGGEGTAGCPEDCGTSCGDGACNGAEASTDCPEDCGTSCGDGACNGAEASTDCPEDCGALCGDEVCNGPEASTDCPDDCGTLCGDEVCNGAEDAATCPGDCPSSCGDGLCTAGETCDDCGADCGACLPATGLQWMVESAAYNWQIPPTLWSTPPGADLTITLDDTRLVHIRWAGTQRWAGGGNGMCHTAYTVAVDGVHQGDAEWGLGILMQDGAARLQAPFEVETAVLLGPGTHTISAKARNHPDYGSCTLDGDNGAPYCGSRLLASAYDPATVWYAESTGSTGALAAGSEWTDVPGVSSTVALDTGTHVQISVLGTQDTGGPGGALCAYRFVVDGQGYGHPDHGQTLIAGPEGFWGPAGLVWGLPLSPGSHAVKLQVRSSGGSGNCTAGEDDADYSRYRMLIRPASTGAGDAALESAGGPLLGEPAVWKDIPGLDVAFDLTDPRHVHFEVGGSQRNEAGPSCGYRLVIDGTPLGDTDWGQALHMAGPQDPWTYTILGWGQELGAGAHTAKLQFIGWSGECTINADAPEAYGRTRLLMRAGLVPPDPCGDGVCAKGFEDCSTCPDDCGFCPGDCCDAREESGCNLSLCEVMVCGLKPYCCMEGGSWDEACVEAAEQFCGCGACGDGWCNYQETVDGCPEDCDFFCGDGTCQLAETPATCPDDCGSSCGDGVCNGAEDAATCPDDCPATCGDGMCTGAETCEGCGEDCGACLAPTAIQWSFESDGADWPVPSGSWGAVPGLTVSIDLDDTRLVHIRWGGVLNRPQNTTDFSAVGFAFEVDGQHVGDPELGLGVVNEDNWARFYVQFAVDEALVLGPGTHTITALARNRPDAQICLLDGDGGARQARSRVLVSAYEPDSVWYAESTGSTGNLSPSSAWTDVPGVATSFSLATAGDVQLSALGHQLAGQTGAAKCSYRFVVDDTPLGDPDDGQAFVDSRPGFWGLAAIVSGLPLGAGEHTARLQARNSGSWGPCLIGSDGADHASFRMLVRPISSGAGEVALASSPQYLPVQAGSWQPVPGLATSLDLPAPRQMHFEAAGTLLFASDTDPCAYRLVIDGAALGDPAWGQALNTGGGSNEKFVQTLLMWGQELAPGAHEIELQVTASSNALCTINPWAPDTDAGRLRLAVRAGVSTDAGFCGDGTCDDWEQLQSCPADCDIACGDGICQPSEGSASCAEDCGSDCGDGACNGGESTATCAEDCGSDCGDGACTGGETSASCPQECFCGDATCGPDENCDDCSDDCGACPLTTRHQWSAESQGADWLIPIVGWGKPGLSLTFTLDEVRLVQARWVGTQRWVGGGNGQCHTGFRFEIDGAPVADESWGSGILVQDGATQPHMPFDVEHSVLLGPGSHTIEVMAHNLVSWGSCKLDGDAGAGYDRSRLLVVADDPAGIWQAQSVSPSPQLQPGSSWTDIPGVSAALDLPHPTQMQLSLHGHQRTTGSGTAECAYRLVVDGVPQGHADLGQLVVSGMPPSMWRPVGLRTSVAVGAGPHTISAQLRNAGSAGVCTADHDNLSYSRFHLTVRRGSTTGGDAVLDSDVSTPGASDWPAPISGFEDIPGLTHTFSIEAPLHMHFEVAGSQLISPEATGTSHVGYRFEIDGVPLGEPDWGQAVHTGGTIATPKSYTALAWGQTFAAGSHTVKVQAKGTADLGLPTWDYPEAYGRTRLLVRSGFTTLFCGDEVCTLDEDTTSCAEDCGALCGDGACNGDESSTTCVEDCGPVCGDGVCNGDENATSCVTDCNVCGNGYCGGEETCDGCPDDCGECPPPARIQWAAESQGADWILPGWWGKPGLSLTFTLEEPRWVQARWVGTQRFAGGGNGKCHSGFSFQVDGGQVGHTEWGLGILLQDGTAQSHAPFEVEHGVLLGAGAHTIEAVARNDSNYLNDYGDCSLDGDAGGAYARSRLLVTADPPDEVWHAESVDPTTWETAAWTDIPGLTTSLDLPAAIQAQISLHGHQRSAPLGVGMCAYRLVIDGVPQGHPDLGQTVVTGVPGSWRPVGLRAGVALGAGGHTISAQIRNAGEGACGADMDDAAYSRFHLTVRSGTSANGDAVLESDVAEAGLTDWPAPAAGFAEVPGLSHTFLLDGPRYMHFEVAGSQLVAADAVGSTQVGYRFEVDGEPLGNPVWGQALHVGGTAVTPMASTALAWGQVFGPGLHTVKLQAHGSEEPGFVTWDHPEAYGRTRLLVRSGLAALACGDGLCDDTEDTTSCAEDCGSECGDGACNDQEWCVSCPGDCGTCVPAAQWTVESGGSDWVVPKGEWGKAPRALVTLHLEEERFVHIRWIGTQRWLGGGAGLCHTGFGLDIDGVHHGHPEWGLGVLVQRQHRTHASFEIQQGLLLGPGTHTIVGKARNQPGYADCALDGDGGQPYDRSRLLVSTYDPATVSYAVSSGSTGALAAGSPWADVPGASATIDLDHAAEVRVSALGHQRTMDDQTDCAYRLLIDGTPQGDANFGQAVVTGGPGDWTPAGLKWGAPLAAGAHSFQLQLRNPDSAGSCAAGDGDVEHSRYRLFLRATDPGAPDAALESTGEMLDAGTSWKDVPGLGLDFDVQEAQHVQFEVAGSQRNSWSTEMSYRLLVDDVPLGAPSNGQAINTGGTQVGYDLWTYTSFAWGQDLAPGSHNVRLQVIGSGSLNSNSPAAFGRMRMLVGLGEPLPVCGDETCDVAESSSTCWQDCGTECGDGTCNGFERCGTCGDDCGLCPRDGGQHWSVDSTNGLDLHPLDPGACGAVPCEGADWIVPKDAWGTPPGMSVTIDLEEERFVHVRWAGTQRKWSPGGVLCHTGFSVELDGALRGDPEWGLGILVQDSGRTHAPFEIQDGLLLGPGSHTITAKAKNHPDYGDCVLNGDAGAAYDRSHLLVSAYDPAFVAYAESTGSTGPVSLGQEWADVPGAVATLELAGYSGVQISASGHQLVTGPDKATCAYRLVIDGLGQGHPVNGQGLVTGMPGQWGPVGLKWATPLDGGTHTVQLQIRTVEGPGECGANMYDTGYSRYRLFLRVTDAEGPEALIQTVGQVQLAQPPQWTPVSSLAADFVLTEPRHVQLEVAGNQSGGPELYLLAVFESGSDVFFDGGAANTAAGHPWTYVPMAFGQVFPAGSHHVELQVLGPGYIDKYSADWNRMRMLVRIGAPDAPPCGDGACEAGETTATCWEDCGSLCGDGVCNGWDDPMVCPEDCPVGCGDGVCAGQEDCMTCASDCANCTGDCCADNGTVGCASASCTAAVCAVDAHCCDVGWDQLCADLALDQTLMPACSVCEYCGSGWCSPSENTADCPEDCGVVCGDGACYGDEDPTNCTDCPTTCGDGICGLTESCDSCSDDCGNCGSCCAPHSSPGCNDPVCEAYVCGVEPTCCTNDFPQPWDAYNCVPLAASNTTECGQCAQCGNGTCENGEGTESPEDTGNCWEDCGMLCGDGVCNGSESLFNCPEDCPGYCGDGTCDSTESCDSCAEDCGLCLGNCCVAHPWGSCEVSACHQQVCAANSWCCAQTWDPFCVDLAIGLCGCPGCGDGTCEWPEDGSSCPQDCPCGDGTCAGEEDAWSCPDDCGMPAGDRHWTAESAGADWVVPEGSWGIVPGLSLTFDLPEPRFVHLRWIGTQRWIGGGNGQCHTGFTFEVDGGHKGAADWGLGILVQDGATSWHAPFEIEYGVVLAPGEHTVRVKAQNHGGYGSCSLDGDGGGGYDRSRLLASSYGSSLLWYGKSSGSTGTLPPGSGWVDVPGLDVTTDLAAGAFVQLSASGTQRTTGAGNAQCAYRFVLDGTPLGDVDRGQTVVVGLASTWGPMGLKWGVSLGAGSHSFALQVRNSGAAGECAAGEYSAEYSRYRMLVRASSPDTGNMVLESSATGPWSSVDTWSNIPGLTSNFYLNPGITQHMQFELAGAQRNEGVSNSTHCGYRFVVDDVPLGNPDWGQALHVGANLRPWTYATMAWGQDFGPGLHTVRAQLKGTSDECFINWDAPAAHGRMRMLVRAP